MAICYRIKYPKSIDTYLEKRFTNIFLSNKKEKKPKSESENSLLKYMDNGDEINDQSNTSIKKNE